MMHDKRRAPDYTISAGQFEAAASLAGLHAEWAGLRSGCYSYAVMGLPLDVAASSHNVQASAIRDALIKIDTALQLAAIAANVSHFQRHPHPFPDSGRVGRLGFWDKVRLGVDT